MLHAICNVLHAVTNNEFENRLFKTMFTLAYFGLFRISELVATRTTNRAVGFSEVKIANDKKSVFITLTVYKNNQYGKPVTLKIPCEADISICPVCSLRSYLAVRPDINGQFFIHMNGTPVTRYQFSAVLQKSLSRTKFGSEKYKSHSFRIGRATQLASSGLPETEIMKLGRWNSTAYLTYIRVNTQN
jgi:site-specific recombinase XerD